MNEKNEQKTVTRMLQEIVDDICDNYCKYPPMMIPENPGDDVDMLEDMMYEQYCAKCPLVRLI